jgi:hypothetical protein
MLRTPYVVAMLTDSRSTNIVKVHAKINEFASTTQPLIARQRELYAETELAFEESEASVFERLSPEVPPTYSRSVSDSALVGNPQKTKEVGPLVRRGASFQAGPSRTRCRRTCKCPCHKRSRLQSPQMLEKLIGSWSANYTGSRWLTWTSCISTCAQRADASMEFQYDFPKWVMMRRLAALYQQAVGGPELLLRVSRQVPSSDKVVALAYQGRLQELRVMFRDKLASPFDVSGPIRNSLLTHAIWSQNAQLCRFLLQQGIDPYLENGARLRPIDEAWTYILTCKDKQKRVEFEEVFQDDEYFDEKEFNIIHRVSTGLNEIDLESVIVSSGEDVRTSNG